MGAVAAVAKLFALLIAVSAAAAAALIVVPAPTHRLALVAIAASEKSVLIAAVAVVALPLAFLGSRRGRRLPAAVAVVLAVAAIVTSALPIVQARRLAGARRAARHPALHPRAHRQRRSGPSDADGELRDDQRHAAGAGRLPAAASGPRRRGARC